MSAMNLRAKINPGLPEEIRSIWIKRCDMVAERIQSEKDIENANIELQQLLGSMLKDSPYLTNVTLIVEDKHVFVQKAFTIRNIKTDKLESVINIKEGMDALKVHFSSEKTIKEFPRKIEKIARRLDRLFKKTFKNHEVKPLQTLLRVSFDTKTKYSF